MKKEKTRTRFDKDLFKFLKTIFTKEKSGAIKTARKDLEEYLKTTHSQKCHKHLAISSDTPPIDPPPEHQFEIGPPTWKEIENTVHWARTASALGTNGWSSIQGV